MQFRSKISRIYWLFVFSQWLLESANATDFYIEEIRSLSELPMRKLIQLKSSLDTEDDGARWDNPKSGREYPMDLPVSLPLKRSNKRPMRRHGEHHEGKGHDTKISKIFQLAVTALSFLAFGGYLLTLIITAIRRNSNMSNQGNVVVFSNLQALQKYKRPKRSLLVYDPMENDFNIERLYHGMILLSRGYALYHQ
ncbi:uncharacterized protein [Prorops nasuta]|uniref:uncharacterized protein n=1 Tax=Prorops nasuta TaxID=863751 RepID=UPI0034CF3F3F